LYRFSSKSIVWVFFSSLNSSFIPPTSTRVNARNWYDQGYEIVNNIVHKRQELVQQIKTMINNEIDLLKKQSEAIRVKKADREREIEEHVSDFFN
jgi:hypothetical protein